MENKKNRGMQVNFVAVVVVRTGKQQQAAPNAVAVWADAQWSGAWRPIAFQHVSSQNYKCYVFAIEHVFTRIPSSWVAPPQASQQKGMNNSIKLHFFQVHGGSKDGNRDFVYSSAFPLLLKTTGTCYGAFNYNKSTGLSTKRLRDVRVVIFRSTACADAKLLRSVQGPDKQHHKDTIRVGDWLDITFCNLWPSMHCSMTNTRTYFRDFGCTFFFCDMCKLFDKEGQSHLPPWLACYALANALIVNNHMPIAEFVQAVAAGDIVPGSVSHVMRVVKCALIPWTMCAREGLYWDDVCLSEPVEDQPFPLSFVPTFRERVFGKDDCEGRASQAQEMRELFEHIYLYAQAHGTEPMLPHIMQTPKLQMRRATCMQLLKGCICIGDLLHHKTLEAQTVVGEANTTAITQPSSSADNAHLIGHSFGLLLYKQGQEYMMVENTGWQRRFLEGVDRRYTMEEVAFMKEFAHHQRGGRNMEKNTRMHMAGNVTKTVERKIYQKICMGHNRLYFSQNTREYGVTLSEIERGQFVAMSMEQVLREMVSGGAWWPAQKDANTMLQLYLEIQKRLPSIRQAVMTPQKSEAEFERLMKNWAPMHEDDLSKGGGGGFWFTVDRKHWPTIQAQMTECMSENLTMQTHGFMHSVLVCIKSRS